MHFYSPRDYPIDITDLRDRHVPDDDAVTALVTVDTWATLYVLDESRHELTGLPWSDTHSPPSAISLTHWLMDIWNDADSFDEHYADPHETDSWNAAYCGGPLVHHISTVVESVWMCAGRNDLTDDGERYQTITFRPVVTARLIEMHSRVEDAVGLFTDVLLDAHGLAGVAGDVLLGARFETPEVTAKLYQ